MKPSQLCRLALLLLPLLAALGPDAWAGGKRAKAAAGAPVRYAKVDASTLRIFALGTVGVATVPGASAPVQVATPQAGHGTGFAVEPDLIVTAQHVVAGARHVVVRRPGKGGFLPARVVYSDEAEDIAILHVDAKLPRIRMQKSEHVLRVRQTVFAVGYPLDPGRTQAQSARGIIAGHLENASLQLDISLNPGNSGGPLVDDKDMVVGMVISRGDVKKGVQGIGVAVPVRKLRLAVAKAHQELASGDIEELSEHDRMSAEVVDHLIRTGALPSGEQVELGDSLETRNLDRQIDQLVKRLDDSDLLVFVAGNLWNAALALEQRRVRTLGNKLLTAQEADALAHDLKSAAIRLARRGDELDPSIHERSKFVDLALRGDVDDDESDEPADDEDDDRVADDVAPGEDPWNPGHRLAAATATAQGIVASAATRRRRSLPAWTVQSTPDMRLADGARALGGELLVARKLAPSSHARLRLFASVGTSAGFAVGSEQVTRSAQSFVALEAGAGVSVALGRTSRLELYGGIAPSYYSVSPDIRAPMTRQSDYVLDHYRATASLAVSWLNITTGVRSISSTLWVEPIGLGVSF